MSERVISRLKKIEDKKNKRQGLLFALLSIGFVLLVIFIGSKFFIQIAVLLGDLRSSSSTIDKGDTIAPAVPRIFSDIEATNSASLNINGYAEPGATVILVKNGSEDLESLSGDRGVFEITDIKLKNGENELAVYARDASGNESGISQSIFVVLDTEAPELTVTSPKNGDEFYDDEREIIVAGEVDSEDVNVRVNGYIVTVDNEGNFVKRLQLIEGDNEIEVKAFDDAGNTVVEKLSVKYSR